MNAQTFKDKAALEQVLSRIPMGRTGELLDLEVAIVYLTSPAASYITGQTIFIDGGWTAR